MIFINPKTEINVNLQEKEKCLNFYKNYHGFRTISSCVEVTGIDKRKALIIKDMLYKERAMGIYYFEANVPPHKYMRDLIKKKLEGSLSNESWILEVGPGENPIFPFSDYGNWYGIDKNFNGGEINFNGHMWANRKYPEGRIMNGGWENISRIEGLMDLHNKFDIVAASHSFEHVFMPIQSLVEASVMLKKGGFIILFVPDGFSDDPSARDEMTHTLFMVPEMINEFFMYSGKYTAPVIETFRPNADYLIMAQKI